MSDETQYEIEVYVNFSRSWETCEIVNLSLGEAEDFLALARLKNPGDKFRLVRVERTVVAE